MGLSKSPSLKPTARSMARLGERATPPVILLERLLSGMISSELWARIRRSVILGQCLQTAKEGFFCENPAMDSPVAVLSAPPSE
jgi:hypothetical protein